jgi:hypothetical protein
MLSENQDMSNIDEGQMSKDSEEDESKDKPNKAPVWRQRKRQEETWSMRLKDTEPIAGLENSECQGHRQGGRIKYCVLQKIPSFCQALSVQHLIPPKLV